jgi:hypothetical protein
LTIGSKSAGLPDAVAFGQRRGPIMFRIGRNPFGEQRLGLSARSRYCDGSPH